jgi:hypothetical protein
VSASSLRAAVAAASRLAPRARELRTEVRAHGGVTACADAVERLVRG